MFIASVICGFLNSVVFYIPPWEEKNKWHPSAGFGEMGRLRLVLLMIWTAVVVSQHWDGFGGWGLLFIGVLNVAAFVAGMWIAVGAKHLGRRISQWWQQSYIRWVFGKIGLAVRTIVGYVRRWR